MANKQKNKKEYQELKGQQWIEMDDLNAPQNQSLSRKFALQQGRKYEEKHIISNISKNNSTQNNQPIEGVIKRENTNNKQNERKQHQNNRRIKKPSIPLMLVTCQYCTVSQNVPGNTQVYTCGSCQNMNQCQPLYGVFNCGNCQARVCYGFGISVMIKCPKCKSINKVPSEPVKKYQAGSKNQSHQKKEQFFVEVQRQRDSNMFFNGHYEKIENQRYEDDFRYPGAQ